MNLGKKISVGAMTLGLSFGALVLGGAACGSTAQETKGESKTCGAGSCGAEKKDPAGGGEKSCGAEKKDPEKGGGEHSCGAGSCGGQMQHRE